MNWVRSADDASKVTRRIWGYEDADKLDGNIRILFSLAGNYLANQNPICTGRYSVLEDESKDPVYCRQRSVYDAEREIR